MKYLQYFRNDESGAVTVDWVVLTSAIVGIAISVIVLISGGVSQASNSILGGFNRDWSFSPNITNSAIAYFDFGINAHPNDQREAWLDARLEVDADAPNGYEYDPNFTTTRYVDDASGNPIYVSDDGSTYSIGGETISAADYDATGNASFRSTFDQYWVDTQ